MKLTKINKVDISLKQLSDINTQNDSYDRVDNIRNGQILTAYVNSERVDQFRFRYLTDILVAGSGITFSTVNGITTISSSGGPGSSPLTTKGDLYTFTSVNARLPVGTNGQILYADSTTATGLRWGANTLPPASGYYGAFSDVTDQFATVINTGYPMLLGVTDLTNGVTVVSGSRITIANTGIYNIQWSGQFRNTGGLPHNVTVWLRKNGVDVPGSAGIVLIPGTHGLFDGHTLPAWNYLINVVGGDYYEFVWSTVDLDVFLSFEAAGSPPPSAASVIVTVTQQSGILAGTGITAINSLTGAVQTLTTGTTGTDFAIVDSGVDHKFNLPIASAVNTGKLSSTDWTTFNDKAPIASPAFTGIPTAPTAASGTDTTQIATTAFVQTAVEQSSSLVGIFGDGGSGNATITGSLSLTNDAYYNDLTISGAGSIFLNGFRLFVKGTLDISNAGANAIYNNGFAGDGSTGVTAGNNSGGGTLGRGGYGQTTSGWFSGASGSNVNYRGGNGGGGATANTNNAGNGVQSPISTQAVSGGSGGTGGKGGNSIIGAGGNGGAGQTTSVSPAVVYTRTFVPDLGRIQTLRQSTAATTVTTISAAGAYHGGGGGGGGSSTTSLGGGGSAGGGGGGNTIVYARQIVVGVGTNASAIAAKGGDGGNSTHTPTTNIGGGGGAGGGGGGYIYLVYGTITGGSYTFASANGGTGGNGGNGSGTGFGGQGGSGGSGGRITAISLGYNTITVVDGTGNLGTVPAIPATTTGSAGGAGGTCTYSS